MSGTERVGAWHHVCSRCGRVLEVAEGAWSCHCGGLLDLLAPPSDPVPPGPALRATKAHVSTLARYETALPPGSRLADLGVSVTPVREVRERCFVKVEAGQPTGSFKDRGAAVMIATAVALGAGAVVADSSGNAGRSVAAHAALAGLDCAVYVPASTATSKLEAIAAYGAAVETVPGPRSAAAAAALDAAVEGRGWYASHVYQPSFHHGVKTLAFELYEQIAGLDSGTVVVPAGNGTLVLGLWIGFGELVAARRMRSRPSIVAVQAANCAPLAGSTASGPTVATGIAVAEPARGGEVRAAVAASGGRVLTVGEGDIHRAVTDLHGMGFDVDPTGAVAWAAVSAVSPERPVVCLLTGGRVPDSGR